MARPVWSGTISFGLIAIPVKLFHAVRKQSVSFNQLDERNMARIRYRKVNAETGEEVTEEHIVKGYEVAKGRYVVVDPEELEPFMPVATKSVDLEEFVDLDEIDPVYFDTAYHLAPDANPKPLRLDAQDPRVERCVMDLAHREAVGDDGLPTVGIGNDVGRVQELPVSQSADAAADLVGLDDALPELALVEALSHQAGRVLP